ncbi:MULTISPECIES: hypothetical protein [Clostridia]|uniref:Uncharacterized protein n=1 Tax=Enterocloster citroniae TaxID=358743 RepID=A0AA41FEL2_9FIRM|nr:MULTISPECIES: hypothetical protein [Clostridia]MBT9810272.1 hypothetical protein [Enterocloster citroniae]MCB7065332.1 hypothetical protein [Enterocloster citroniae]MCC3383915.1 hypothetical protein [Enterocloster citroniae]RGC10713.1 hypothetical protein DWZ14_10920 [Enterocloster citroniae]
MWPKRSRGSRAASQDEQPDLAALSSYSNSVGNGIGKMSHYNEKEGERKWHYCIPRNKKN